MALIFGVYWSGQHKNGLITERSYQGRFVRATGMPIAPVYRPDTAPQATVLMPTQKRKEPAEDAAASELESYTSARRRKIRE